MGGINGTTGGVGELILAACRLVRGRHFCQQFCWDPLLIAGRWELKNLPSHRRRPGSLGGGGRGAKVHETTANLCTLISSNKKNISQPRKTQSTQKKEIELFN